MAGRPPNPRDGQRIDQQASGFPLFFEKRKPRAITANPWAFLSHLALTKLDAHGRDVTTAYIQQGSDFFEAAQNPRLHSRPLLYYYAFLNLVKAALLISGIDLPATAKHGISDPRANSRQRLRLEGQTVRINARSHDRSQIFAEFLHLLGHAGHLPRDIRVLDLLKFIPGIHRTYTEVENSRSYLVPTLAFDLFQDDHSVWTRIRLARHDKDVRNVLPALKRRLSFRRNLAQVASATSDELWFESNPIPARRRGLDLGIVGLASNLQTIGISPILTPQGYKWYLIDSTPMERLPYLATAYAVVFYLGSITRYKPHDFGKIIAGKHSWIVDEFLATQPTQFLYCLASQLAGVDVVRPGYQ